MTALQENKLKPSIHQSSKILHPTEDLNSSDDSEDDENAEIEPDETYDNNEDEENVAWVYKHLRGGGVESVNVIKKGNESKSNGNNNGTGSGDEDAELEESEQPSKSPSQPTTKTSAMKILKPRNSDAVLSCPCCFTCICMDTQRHEQFENQYRGMFVMNISVDWSKVLVYDEDGVALEDSDLELKGVGEGEGGSGSKLKTSGDCDEEECEGGSEGKVKTSDDGDEEEYYQVLCLSCNTKVAVLNMNDEVYHFYGCIASHG